MEYRTIDQEGNAQIVEKKSRFIARVVSIRTEEEAAELLEKIRKQYWDARHHCWAYVIGEGQVQERFSDDGEPAGTAGKPILEVIRGQELRNVMIVVTRYFGGILLGTGGLVRAYTQAAQEGVLAAEVVTKIKGARLVIRTDYTDLGKIQYLLAQRNIPVEESVYAENVELYVFVSEEEEKRLTEELREATNARAGTERIEMCWFSRRKKMPA